jgi:hypothetical protein
MHEEDPASCIERRFITARCEDSKGVVEVDALDSVNSDTQDAEAWTVLVVAV